MGVTVACMHACADSAQRDVGLSLAVASMQRGERCRLHVQPLYGYGNRGTISGSIKYPATIIFRSCSAV